MKKILFYITIFTIVVIGQDRKVLFIGLDGCRSDALNVAYTPNIDSLIDNGLIIENALSSINGQATYSGPGWSSMLTGVWYDKHGVSDNSFVGSNFDQFPPFNILLNENGNDFHSASFIMWTPIHSEIFSGSMEYNENHPSYNASVAQAAANYMTTEELDILFLDFDHIDHAGHSYGFAPDVLEYINTIEEIDEYIGLVISAMEERTNYNNEEWLVIITSDHGGNMGGHGGQTIEERIIPIILSGNYVDNFNVPEQAYIVDIVPTIIQFLDQGINCSWDLDGTVIGLNTDLIPQQNPCPTCPNSLNITNNQLENSISLSWQENLAADYTYSIYRNEELIIQLDGLSSYYIDYPPLIGIGEEFELNYNVVLESNLGEVICNAQVTTNLSTGIILLDENFDSLELFPAEDEGFISDGGCTNTISQDVLGWTHEPPYNWILDNSQMPNTGTLEWRGWSFASKIFWVMAEDQLRSQFIKANQNIAVVDPDEWDDCNDGASGGPYNSALYSPTIAVSEGISIKLSFDSHYRNESPQQVFLTISHSNGEEEILLHYSDDDNSDNNGEDMLNEYLVFNYQSQIDDSIQFIWKIMDAGNNWYWAIDNVKIQINTPAIGDLNNDSLIDILDIIIIVNNILFESNLDEIINHISDVNNDGLINILDVIQIVDYILNN